MLTRNCKAVSHPIFARLYASQSVKAERRGLAEHRRRLLAGLSGRVIEVGAGNGLNFPHYPDTVESVLAIEPEDYLRERALAAAAGASVPIEVRMSGPIHAATAQPRPGAETAFQQRAAARL